MYLDHEENRKGDISPSWTNQTRESTSALSRRHTRQGPGDFDGSNAAFMPPRNIKILGEGRPRGPRRDRTTDVARQHDTGRPQGDQNSGVLNPAPGEHTR